MILQGTEGQLLVIKACCLCSFRPLCTGRPMRKDQLHLPATWRTLCGRERLGRDVPQCAVVVLQFAAPAVSTPADRDTLDTTLRACKTCL